MDVRCPACAAITAVDEQHLRGASVRVRCPACASVWLIAGRSEGTSSESKRAAVIRRGAAREYRDLFASRPADLGSVKQTLRPPPQDSQLGGVAARNEASVLFTVDALRDNARMKTPQPQLSPVVARRHRTEEDEGMIDLLSLASAPKAGGRAVPPLFMSEPPPAAFAADVAGSSPYGAPAGAGSRSAKRALAGIAAAAVAVVLCGVGLAAAFRGEEPVAHANANASSMLMAPMVTPAVVTPAPAPVPAAPSASASGSAAEEEAKAPAVGVNGKKQRGGKGKAGKGFAKASFTKVQSSGVNASEQPAVAKIPKASDKCGCKGNFDCILRCAATGK